MIVPTGSATKVRRYDLDWLRVGAFALLIAYHIGMFYVGWDWHIKSRFSGDAIEPLMRLINPWRLPLLFLVSGMALRFALDGSSPARVSRQRLKRLGLPLLFGFFVLCAPQTYFELLRKGEISGNYWDFYVQYLDFDFEFSILTPAWNHLWYLIYLLIYTVIICAAAGPIRRLAAWLDHIDVAGTAKFVLAVPPILFVLANVTLAHRFPVTHDLVNDWYTHAISLTAMLFGYLVARSPSFWQAVESAGRWAAAGALVLSTMMVTDVLDASNVGAVRLLYGWCVIVALLDFGARHLNRDSPLLAYLNQAMLPYYVMHQTLIVSLGALATACRLPFLLEIVVVGGGTILGCAIGYELVRRILPLRPLFGLPLQPGQPRPPAPAPALF